MQIQKNENKEQEQEKEKITRRKLRNYLFRIRFNTVNNLQSQERNLAHEIKTLFDGYLLGPIGWSDFTIKWDINPGDPEDFENASQRKLTIEEWGGEIMTLWEWKNWIQEFQKICEKKYGKNAVRGIFPPPCFTRQG